MKLAIYTQYRENYGAHSWDGEGQCPQYWKNKGGDVYVVEDITVDQACRIGENGIPTLKSLIEYSDDYSEEFIIEWGIVDEAEGEKIAINDWETPKILKWDGSDWYVTETQPIEEGLFTECVRMYRLTGRGPAASVVKYRTQDGELVSYNEAIAISERELAKQRKRSHPSSHL